MNVDGLAFVHDGNRILGFASSKVFKDIEVFYLHGVAVANSFKVNGAAKALVKALMNSTGYSKIAFTTQNPIMFRLIRSICQEVYPNPFSGVIPENITKIGSVVINGRSGSFDQSSFVVTNLYDRCLYSVIPDCGDSIINDWFKKSLDVSGGLTRNAFLFIGGKNV